MKSAVSFFPTGVREIFRLRQPRRTRASDPIAKMQPGVQKILGKFLMAGKKRADKSI